jgi:hypothetical protein
MEAIKRQYFRAHPDEPIIFHRKEMVNFRHPFEAFSNPEIREGFDSDLLRLLSEWQYMVITVCLDKKRHKETYSVDVQEKAKAALEYCRNATEFTTSNGGKPWKYLLIPHNSVMTNMSFETLSRQLEAV